MRLSKMRLRKVSTPMTFQYEMRFFKSATWTAFLTIGISTLLAMPVFAEKGARCIVTREGKRLPLVISTTEFGVTLKANATTESSAARLTASGLGTLTDINDRADVRTKLMTVATASSKQRLLIMQDVEVADVRNVYYHAGDMSPFISTGKLAVRVNSGLSDVAINQLWDDYSVEVVTPQVAGLKDVYLVKPRHGVTDEVLRAEVLAADRRTVWSQPDFQVKLQTRQFVTPEDPFYSLQWHLENSGSIVGQADADIDVRDAWAVTLGEGVRLGMFDDSCDVLHEDLRDNYLGIGDDVTIVNGSPGADDPSPKFVFDNHGTRVMGLAVASANSVGLRGVAPAAKFTASRGLKDLPTDSEIASAYTFARQQNVDVHNNSWGFVSPFPVPEILQDAIDKAFNDGRDLDGTGGDRPRGMVVVFASGNSGIELPFREDFSTLHTVIGVGASDAFDRLAFFSNYGPEIDVIAPGTGDGNGFANGLIATTDNQDFAYPDPGCNVGGQELCFSGGVADIDPDGLYTKFFSGTSASCPIVSGVAALILSVNPILSATDVRIILEHTTDKVDPGNAAYHGISGRSLRYGYGRVNAGAAVKAAQDSQGNGGRTWPERVGSVRAANGQLSWRQNGDRLEFRVLEEMASSQDDSEVILPELRTTDEFLILSSNDPFDFIPVDGDCYSRLQIGCESDAITIKSLPNGVVIHSDDNQSGVGCGFSCLAEGTAACEVNSIHCMNFDASNSKKYFAIYARSTSRRYSFGVAVDSDGNITDEAFIPGSSIPPPLNPVDLGPQISIRVSPRLGLSPLEVRFQGNAFSEFAIDDAKTAWDFDVDDDVEVDTSSRIATHTYVVDAGETKTFTARLTMIDVSGNEGFAQTTITVTGPDADDANRGTGDSGVISVSIPGATGSDVDTGVSPFSVELSVNTSGVSGTLQSIRWDLGDGTTADSLFVTHTYVNETDRELRLPITVQITTATSGSTILTTSISRTITVLPGAGVDEGPGEVPVLDGAGASGAGGTGTPCGVVSMLPMFIMLFTLAGYRRFWS